VGGDAIHKHAHEGVLDAPMASVLAHGAQQLLSGKP